MSIEFCESRIEDLKRQKRELVRMMTRIFTQQHPMYRIGPSVKSARKSFGVRMSLKGKIKNPKTRKMLVEQADLEDAKDVAMEIDSVEKSIEFMEERQKCIIMAAERSISLEAAQKLVQQEEKLTEKQKVSGEDSPESSLPPPVHPYPPFPEGGDSTEYQAWIQEYQRVQDLNAPINNLPTQTRGHKDPTTVAAVVDPDDKRKLINVAKAVVNVYFPLEFQFHQDLEDLDGCCSGVIIEWDMDNKTARILTCGYFGHNIYDDTNIDDVTKSKIFVRWPWPCKEDDGLIEAKLMFFSRFYQLSLLEVAFQGTLLDIPTQIPPFGLSPPKLGDEVFALGRDRDLSLVVRRGTIMQQQPLRGLCQGYHFVDCELPKCGKGGPVVDHHGNVAGLSICCYGGISAIFPISTALSCFQMWTKFGRIARPLLGMRFRSVEVLDDLSGDIRSDGLVVDKVDLNSAAWKHGIRSGNAIRSFHEQSPKPLPEFEDFLLSLGSEHLQGTCMEVGFELEVEDAPGVKRSITLHVPFSDVASVRY